MVLGLAWTGAAAAEDWPAGVVTAVHGTASVARISLDEPGALKVRDPVFARDRITTGDRSFARLLLGGKALVTAREHSVLTITTAPGMATIEARRGRLVVVVAKSLNPSGETIASKTRNAVVAVRGTVVVAEVMPSAAADRTQDHTVFTVLRGVVDFYGLDPRSGQASPAQRLGALQSVTIKGFNVPSAATITPAQAKRLGDEFTMHPRAQATSSSVARTHVGKAARMIESLLRPPSGTSGPSTQTKSITSPPDDATSGPGSPRSGRDGLRSGPDGLRSAFERRRGGPDRTPLRTLHRLNSGSLSPNTGPGSVLNTSGVLTP